MNCSICIRTSVLSAYTSPMNSNLNREVTYLFKYWLINHRYYSSFPNISNCRTLSDWVTVSNFLNFWWQLWFWRTIRINCTFTGARNVISSIIFFSMPSCYNKTYLVCTSMIDHPNGPNCQRKGGCRLKKFSGCLHCCCICPKPGGNIWGGYYMPGCIA